MLISVYLSRLGSDKYSISRKVHFLQDKSKMAVNLKHDSHTLNYYKLFNVYLPQNSHGSLCVTFMLLCESVVSPLHWISVALCLHCIAPLLCWVSVASSFRLHCVSVTCLRCVSVALCLCLRCVSVASLLRCLHCVESPLCLHCVSVVLRLCWIFVAFCLCCVASPLRLLCCVSIASPLRCVGSPSHSCQLV